MYMFTDKFTYPANDDVVWAGVKVAWTDQDAGGIMGDRHVC